jgi:hypothetical protein
MPTKIELCGPKDLSVTILYIADWQKPLLGRTRYFSAYSLSDDVIALDACVYVFMDLLSYSLV